MHKSKVLVYLRLAQILIPEQTTGALSLFRLWDIILREVDKDVWI
jgi:hypothetical protein